MNISIQPTNFKGAFEINYRIAQKRASTIKNDFEARIKDKRSAKIINGWSGKDYKTLYVIQDSNDKSIAEFLSQSDILGFIYYPEINKTIKTSYENVDEIRRFLADRMTKRIINTKDMLNYIEEKEKSTKPAKSVKAFNAKFDLLVTQILRNLCIDDLPGRQRCISCGITKIEDNNYSIGYFRMSPAGKKGYRFVYAKANNINAPEYKCLVDKNGNIVKYYISIAEQNEFTKLFNKLVQDYNLNKAK